MLAIKSYLLRVIESAWAMLPDKCEVCGGTKGGVRGNENVIVVDGNPITVCDFCHADRMTSKEGRTP